MTLNNTPSKAGVPQQRDARFRLDPTAYRAITREQWLLRETRIVARLRIDEGLSNVEIASRVREQNAFQYPTEHSSANIASTCLRRLDALGEDATAEQVTNLIAHGSADEARQANLYLLMRAYRLVREFMLSVVARKFQSLDLVLTRSEVQNYLEELRQSESTVSTWTDLTLGKCRQVLMKSLAEAGLSDPPKAARREYDLRPLVVEPRVEQVITAAGDRAFLGAFGRRGAES